MQHSGPNHQHVSLTAGRAIWGILHSGVAPHTAPESILRVNTEAVAPQVN